MWLTDEIHASQGEAHVLHPSSRLLFRYWEAARAEQSAPRRDQLDLKSIKHLLPHLFIAEADPRHRTFRWRLAGTSLCDLHRRELTGTSLLSGFDDFECEVIRRLLGATLSRRQPAMLRFRFITDLGQEIGTELAAFPIVAADGSFHILGGLFPFREVSMLGYSAIVQQDVVGARLIWTENLPDTIVPAITSARPRLKLIAGGLES